MYISSLLIKNFRSIEKQKIIFNPGKNVLVGKNNAGKSNIIKALDFILGEKNPLYIDISEKDFYTCKDENDKHFSERTFVIAAKLEGNDINEELLRKINGVWLADIGYTNYLEEYFCNNARLDKSMYINFQGLNNKKYLKDKEEFLNMFKNAEELYIYFCVIRNDSEENIFNLDCVQSCYSKTYSILLRYSENYYRLSKFSNDLRDSLITSAILPAVRDINKQLKINTWSWYGKLIKDIWDKSEVERKKEIDSKLDEIKNITDSIFINATVDIKEKLESAIYHSDVSFQLLQNTKDDIFKGINIFVDDGIQGLLEDKGTGIQSAIIIALFSYYCSKFHKNSSLLVVEEPEIFLHPQARRVISCKFDEFVNLNSVNKNQVIITTHSAEFIRNTPLENIIIVKKEEGKTVSKKIIIESNKSKDLAKIQNIISTKNAEMFFADKVILVEGGEEYLIPLIADEYTGESCILDKKNITVAKVGGKSLFKPYMQLLRMLGIEYYVIADFDVLINGLEQLGEFISDFDIDELNILKSCLNDMLTCDELWGKSKKIRSKILEPDKSIDAKVLCGLLDKICSKEEYDSELGVVWSFLRPKVQSKVNYEILKRNESLKNRVFKYIDKIKSDNIFVLKKGELEDYITPQGVKVIQESGFANQKELKMIKLTESITSREIKLTEVIDINEYLEVIKRIFPR